MYCKRFYWWRRLKGGDLAKVLQSALAARLLPAFAPCRRYFYPHRRLARPGGVLENCRKAGRLGTRGTSRVSCVDLRHSPALEVGGRSGFGLGFGFGAPQEEIFLSCWFLVFDRAVLCRRGMCWNVFGSLDGWSPEVPLNRFRVLICGVWRWSF